MTLITGVALFTGFSILDIVLVETSGHFALKKPVCNGQVFL